MLVKTVVDAVFGRLKESTIPGIHIIEKGILPEGRIPASYGQRFLCVSPEQITDISNPIGDVRKRQVRISINLIQRVRDIPNDRFGEIAYMQQDSMTDILDAATNIIENYLSVAYLRDRAIFYELKYGISGTFVLNSATVDPIHLYPSFFNATSYNENEESDKIAGYRMSYYFTSPIFIKSIPFTSTGTSECDRPITPAHSPAPPSSEEGIDFWQIGSTFVVS